MSEELCTVDEALFYVRKNVRNKRNIYYLYIIDQFYHLKRALSIRELLSAAGNEPITDIMVSDVTSLSTGVDQEKPQIYLEILTWLLFRL
ncbi:hypothetical protein J22TS1_21120 [Siminovitchia terrae]|uniref:hypothetical protein n=1 Tax=Siminovitchia terrae TaxID=1914933 RepID=UPI001AFD3B58|nr:hypothetical protein [Siminovitchia terrae]GIN91061.1 hypothetical protein J22TS1_21120 [Siminovitchia terrae]